MPLNFSVKNITGTKVSESSTITSITHNLIKIQQETKGMRELLSRHIATIINYDIIGVNSLRPVWSGSTYGTHAEVDALRKLPYNFSKRIISIDMLVIRTVEGDKLTFSKPCNLCLQRMANLVKTRYRIRHIYYSDGDGTIVKATFDSLASDKCQYQCKRQKKRKIRGLMIY